MSDGLPRYTPVTATVDGHGLQLAITGAERLRALLSLITGAKRSLRLFFYIFEGDACGTRVLNALADARRRGVRVWLIVDGFGAANTPDEFFAPLVSAGGIFKRFNAGWGRGYLLRNHQKMAIADKTCALIGGANVGDHYFHDRPEGSDWHDMVLRAEGPAVARLARYFDSMRNWLGAPAPGLRGLIRILGRRSDKQGPLRWLMGGPFQRMSPLTHQIKIDVEHAQQLDLIQAYFAPNWGMLRRLGRVVTKRGGVVRLVSAARSDNRTTIAAARHCFRRLLSRGVQVYEYLPQKLHMKLIVADDVTYIGSANFDMRSLFINGEVMLRIDDKGFANAMRAFVAEHLPHCAEIDPKTHHKVSWLTRARWLVSYFLVSTVDFTVTRRVNLRRV